MRWMREVRNNPRRCVHLALLVALISGPASCAKKKDGARSADQAREPTGRPAEQRSAEKQTGEEVDDGERIVREESAPGPKISPGDGGPERRQKDRKEHTDEDAVDEEKGSIAAEADDGSLFAEDPSGTNHRLSGKASWYGEDFQGEKTASGESFDMNAKTAAHPTLPFHSTVRVTEPKGLRSVEVRINDRGPFKRGYVIDLSYAAARELELVDSGVRKVHLEVLEWGDGARDGADDDIGEKP
jgi:rare lipoprotein A